ncbi:unnamed protein product [Effrenium voratum]|nr:unnamed protein product [Effrenium voratum]
MAAMLSSANGILGYDLLDLCLTGPEAKLEETRYCQPAMFLAGLAAVEKLKGENSEHGTRFQAAAGLSLGEYTALCAAGAFTFEDVHQDGARARACAGASHARLALVGAMKLLLALLATATAVKFKPHVNKTHKVLPKGLLRDDLQFPLFVHIPKTAGTSIWKALGPNYTDSGRYPEVPFFCMKHNPPQDTPQQPQEQCQQNTHFRQKSSAQPVCDFALVACAMAESRSAAFWRDDEIVTDRSGIPHCTGANPALMKEYRRRVLFAFNSLEGDGEDEAKEKRDLDKKKARFGRQLLEALHGEAWRICEPLTLQLAELKQPDGYQLIFKQLQQLEKAPIIRKTEAFDHFFDNCFRRRGQPIDEYMRSRKRDWEDLTDLCEGTTMSEDLRAYFLLKNINLSRDDRRSILLANASDFSMEGIEKAFCISFYDVHEREKAKIWYQRAPPTGKKRHWAHQAWAEEDPSSEYHEQEHADQVEEDEQWDEWEEAYEAEEQPSDEGASQHEEVDQAYATYKESRKKLKEIHKSQGFFKGELTFEEMQLVPKEVLALDLGSQSQAIAIDVQVQGDAEDVYAFMVGPGDQEEDLMVQDMGKNEYDAVESSLVNDEHKSYATAEAPKPWISDVEKNALEIREKVQITLDIPTKKS